MKSKYQKEIVVEAGKRKHANFGTLAVVEPNGIVLVTDGARAQVYEKGTAFILPGGTVEHVEGAYVYVALKLKMFLEVPSNEILNGLDPRTHRKIYDYPLN